MKRVLAVGLLCALVVSASFVAPVLGVTPVVVDHTATTVRTRPWWSIGRATRYDATGAIPEVTGVPLHGSAAFDGDVLTYTPDPATSGRTSSATRSSMSTTATATSRP